MANANFDCIILEMPEISTVTRTEVAEVHERMKQLIDDGWKMIGHTNDGKLSAIWVKPQIGQLYRVEKIGGEVTEEAIVLAHEESYAKHYARMANPFWHFDDMKVTLMDVNDMKTHGHLVTNTK